MAYVTDAMREYRKKMAKDDIYSLEPSEAEKKFIDEMEQKYEFVGDYDSGIYVWVKEEDVNKAKADFESRNLKILNVIQSEMDDNEVGFLIDRSIFYPNYKYVKPTENSDQVFDLLRKKTLTDREVGYLRKNFVKSLSFDDLVDLNHQQVE